jgi:signal peptidase II
MPFILPALFVILLDQLTKFLIIQSIPLHASRPVISGFFNLVHIRNRGMAFGMMNRPGSELSSFLLVAVTLVAILLLIYWFIRLKEQERSMIFGFSLVLGGAGGNLIDRLRFGEVVDFLDFFIGHYHWPAFNVADAAITIGTFWIAMKIFFRGSKAR